MDAKGTSPGSREKKKPKLEARNNKWESSLAKANIQQKQEITRTQIWYQNQQPWEDTTNAENGIEIKTSVT